ncbi:phage tail protein [Yersinia sp. HM-2024]|uniref:phage tail protein n=1 Tax=Yersinia sp. HM-2024 TaxID=3344550 RepID=UPI00370D0CFE
MAIKFDKDGYALTAGEVTVYNAAPDTGEFIAASKEFLNVGQGLPANAYLDSPRTAKKGFAVCRTHDGLAWEYQKDYRGEIRYSTLSGEQVTVVDLGDYPADTTDSAPARFTRWDGVQWAINDNLLAATARMFRDTFIIATDPLMVSDYSIDDAPLTEEQRGELIGVRAIYRSWPTVAGWPLVELPELPQWLLIEAVNNGYRVPIWPDASYVA